MKYNDSHLFALYWQSSSDLKENTQITIDDPDLVRRITQILRLKEGEELQLFDHAHHALVIIKQIERRSVQIGVGLVADNQPFSPEITILLPLLKRDALSSALYHLVEAGVNHIQLVTTEKSAHRWSDERDLERCKRVIIAAAEQSKNFTFPDVHAPIHLAEALVQNNAALRYFGNIDGTPLLQVTCALKKEQSKVLAVGPEADFSASEQKLLREKGFEPIGLGPTILRAETAVFFLSASFRSVFN